MKNGLKMNNLLAWIHWVKSNPSSYNIDSILLAHEINELLGITQEFKCVSKKLLKESKDVKLNKETRLVLKKLAKWEKYGASNE